LIIKSKFKNGKFQLNLARALHVYPDVRSVQARIVLEFTDLLRWIALRSHGIFDRVLCRYGGRSGSQRREMDTKVDKSKENIDPNGGVCRGVGPEGAEDKRFVTGVDSKEQLSVGIVEILRGGDCSVDADAVEVGLHSANYGVGRAKPAGVGDCSAERNVREDQ
jgi:hypothetical protein